MAARCAALRCGRVSAWTPACSLLAIAGAPSCPCCIRRNTSCSARTVSSVVKRWPVPDAFAVEGPELTGTHALVEAGADLTVGDLAHATPERVTKQQPFVDNSLPLEVAIAGIAERLLGSLLCRLRPSVELPRQVRSTARSRASLTTLLAWFPYSAAICRWAASTLPASVSLFCRAWSGQRSPRPPGRSGRFVPAPPRSAAGAGSMRRGIPAYSPLSPARRFDRQRSRSPGSGADG